MKKTLGLINPVFSPNNFVLSGMIFVFLLIIFRSTGIYPVVFADEWSYSSFSRLVPLSEAGVPSYFYLFFFRLTNVCGDGFLECARILNAALLVISAPIIYSIGRRFCSNWIAALIAVVSILGPFNIYATFFMPESMYFSGFWVFSWIILTQYNRSPFFYGIFAGTALGVLSLIKVHALFLLPASCLYFVYFFWCSNSLKRWRSGFISLTALCLSFVLTKFFFGFLLAGSSGITIFGSIYSSQVNGVVNSRLFIDLLIDALINLGGHAIALTLLFCLPITIILARKWRIRDESLDDHFFLSQNLAAYSIFVFITLLIVVSFFTASVAGTGPYETLSRLHMRYYNFAFPLLLLVVASEFKHPKQKFLFCFFSVFIVISILLLGLYFSTNVFTPSFVDSPEFRGLTRNNVFFHAVVILGILITLFWLVNKSFAAFFFIAALSPIIVVWGTFQVSSEVRARQISDSYDEAGLFVKKFLKSDSSRLTIVAPNVAGLLRTLFHIDDPKVNIIQLDPGAPINLTNIPENTKWILLIGNYQIPPSVGFQISFGSYSLIQPRPNYFVDFSKSSWVDTLSSIHGLSNPEAWGTWSTGSEVLLEFANFLPSKFKLTLEALAFGPNAEKEFVLIVGNQKRSFQLGLEPKYVTFDFEDHHCERLIKIMVPSPTAPSSLGLSADDRKLGIGLIKIEILPTP